MRTLKAGVLGIRLSLQTLLGFSSTPNSVTLHTPPPFPGSESSLSDRENDFLDARMALRWWEPALGRQQALKNARYRGTNLLFPAPQGAEA